MLPIFASSTNIERLTGLDDLAKEKRGKSDSNVMFKVPRERVTSVAASVNEVELESSGLDEITGAESNSLNNHLNRRYRDTTAREITQEGMRNELVCG